MMMVYFTDPSLLQKLAADKIEQTAECLRKDGWKWVEVRPDFDYSALRHFGQLKQDYGDVKYSKADMAQSGVVVSLGYNGKTEIKRGLLKAEDVKEIKKATKAKKATAKIENAPKSKDPTALISALVETLTRHRTAALQAKLAENPKVALVAIVHRLTTDLIVDGAGVSNIRIDARDQIIDADDPDMKGSEAAAQTSAAVKDLRKSLPKDEGKFWDWLLKQDQKNLLDILAVCVAATVDAVDRKRGSFDGEYSEDHVDQLSDALKLNMTEYWQPTATNYFDRVSSAQIIAAVTEACGKAEAQTLAGMKKGEMAKAAEKKLKGKGWLPAILRTPA
jgi:ParB family transcriptional regulator, chromosome partitioning protein